MKHVNFSSFVKLFVYRLVLKRALLIAELHGHCQLFFGKQLFAFKTFSFIELSPTWRGDLDIVSGVGGVGNSSLRALKLATKNQTCVCLSLLFLLFLVGMIGNLRNKQTN